MIRVLHSVSNMDRAGIETMLMNYYRRMDRSVIQFDFLCNKQPEGAYAEEIRSLGGRVFTSPGLNPVKYPAYGRFMAALLAENPDIRILHAHNEAMAAYALLTAKKAGCKTRIFHSHNTRIEHDYKYPLKLLCKQLLRFGYTERWACSEAAARFYFGASPAVVIPNAIQTARYAFSQANRDSLRAAFGLNGCFVVGHVGRFNMQKNHAFLLEAFAEVYRADHSARLVLLGEGGLQADVRAQAETLGIGSAVLMPGSVANVDAWYSAFDVFTLPSLFEGLPVVGVEAQTSGVRCLFSDKVTREVDVTGHSAFLPLDKGAWVKAIQAAKQAARDGDAVALVKQAGYDIDLAAPALQARYLALAAQAEKA